MDLSPRLSISGHVPMPHTYYTLIPVLVIYIILFHSFSTCPCLDCLADRLWAFSPTFSQLFMTAAAHFWAGFTLSCLDNTILSTTHSPLSSLFHHQLLMIHEHLSGSTMLTLQVSNTQLVLAFRRLSYICHGRCPFRPSTPSNISFFVALWLELFNFLSLCWLSAASCIFAISVAIVHSGHLNSSSFSFYFVALWVRHSLIMQAFSRLLHLCHSPWLLSIQAFTLNSHFFLVALASILHLAFGHFCIALGHLRLSDSTFPLLFTSCPIHTVYFPIPTSHPRNCPAVSHPHKPPL